MAENMINNLKISIVGGGVVGRAVSAFYSGVKIYDKYRPVDSLSEVVKADYIFVAVPTPYKDGPDLTEMDDAIENLVKNLPKDSKAVVIIKSTVAPGTTDAYQKKYPDLNLVFSPEFLTERTAVEDFAKPDKQLVGYSDKTKDSAAQVLAILPPAPYQKILPAKECEIVKYAINSFYAFKVIFGNQIFDLCQKLNLDYDHVRRGLATDQRIVDSHFDVLHGGYRGFGGKCLPKDVATLAWCARKNGTPLKFIEKIIELNNNLREVK
ncbi:UDP-glucose/GDP-mannose dehydrogenase family protein [bacterium]|nr:MAG: UDP-glucose/GDP-mannose dehydrogenase family protein [bacterium]